MRKRHQNKEIEAAVARAEARGWVVYPRQGHVWGMLLCPGGAGGCRVFVWSTPAVPQNHAKGIDRQVRKCLHRR